MAINSHLRRQTPCVPEGTGAAPVPLDGFWCACGKYFYSVAALKAHMRGARFAHGGVVDPELVRRAEAGEHDLRT